MGADTLRGLPAEQGVEHPEQPSAEGQERVVIARLLDIIDRLVMSPQLAEGFTDPALPELLEELAAWARSGGGTLLFTPSTSPEIWRMAQRVRFALDSGQLDIIAEGDDGQRVPGAAGDAAAAAHVAQTQTEIGALLEILRARLQA